MSCRLLRHHTRVRSERREGISNEHEPVIKKKKKLAWRACGWRALGTNGRGV